MNRLLLSTVAAAALFVSGAAFAQSAGAPEQPATTGDGASQEMTTQGAGATTGTEQMGTGAPGTTKEEPAGTATPGQPIVYGSYLDRSDKFTGEIAGGFAAEDLIGKEVVGPSGDSVGHISDLLIGPDQRITQALVDSGGFLGIGAKTVALDIESLQVAQNGEDAIVANVTEEEIDALPAYEKSDEGWMVGQDY